MLIKIVGFILSYIIGAIFIIITDNGPLDNFKITSCRGKMMAWNLLYMIALMWFLKDIR